MCSDSQVTTVTEWLMLMPWNMLGAWICYRICVAIGRFIREEA